MDNLTNIFSLYNIISTIKRFRLFNQKKENWYTYLYDNTKTEENSRIKYLKRDVTEAYLKGIN